jgi:hypothetical protein
LFEGQRIHVHGPESGRPLLPENLHSGEKYWLEDYKITVTPSYDSIQVEISGRYYHYDFGYADVSTVEALQFSTDTQSGKLRFDAGETWSTMTFAGNDRYVIEGSELAEAIEGFL